MSGILNDFCTEVIRRILVIDDIPSAVSSGLVEILENIITRAPSIFQVNQMRSRLLFFQNGKLILNQIALFPGRTPSIRVGQELDQTQSAQDDAERIDGAHHRTVVGRQGPVDAALQSRGSETLDSGTLPKHRSSGKRFGPNHMSEDKVGNLFAIFLITICIKYIINI